MHCLAIFKPFLRQSTTSRKTHNKLAETCIYHLFSISCWFPFSSLACGRPKEMRHLKRNSSCQKRQTFHEFCETCRTPRHWSGFLRSLAAARAHCERRGSWFSSEKQLICWKVPMIRLIAASCARLSEISSSYKEKACNIIITLWVNNKSTSNDLGHVLVGNSFVVSKWNGVAGKGTLKDML